MEDNNKENEKDGGGGLRITDERIKKLRVSKLFEQNNDTINGIDFSPAGDLLISSAEDDRIIIYDCEKGEMKTTLFSKKYGASQIHFTHTKDTAIYASTKIDDTIRYLSLPNNKYLRYFSGHKNVVTTLSMSPKDEAFLSASLDKTLRLWDFRLPDCVGVMHLPGKPVGAFDPEGIIFAVGVNNECLLYDLRAFQNGPFSAFPLDFQSDHYWSSLKFNPDGKSMMICSDGPINQSIHLMDAFYGTTVQTFSGPVNSPRVALDACFSSDGKYIFSGAGDGSLHVWNAEEGYKVCSLVGDHPMPLKHVQFNPKYMMIATTCTNMAFWIPSSYDDIDDDQWLESLQTSSSVVEDSTNGDGGGRNGTYPLDDYGEAFRLNIISN